MMTVLGTILLSLLAGWVVNVVADTVPARRALRETWRWPFQRLGLAVGESTAVGGASPRRYLIVWLMALALGWFAYLQIGWTPKALLIAVEAWFFLAIAVIDLEHRLVLNRMLVVAAPLFFAANLLMGEVTMSSILLGAVTGFGIFLILALLSPGGMGMGDVKLAGLIGLTTGVSDVLAALFIAILVGGIAGAVILLKNYLRRRNWRGQTMAYAPYLVVGVWIVLFDGIRLLHNYLERL
ncbi:MAG: prepilin peptidase [Caldilineaceae bacterium]|jgi:leader peptidase (prepilin peptidase)/N-methyltransferase